LERIVKQVFLTSRALKDLEKSYVFNSKLYGFQVAKEIINEIINCIEVLENTIYDFSKIGSVDEEFKHLKRNYRKLIQGHYKITYREGQTKVYINRIFDTRQNPNKNK
jgi:plasmid stabilization system protein ParE